MATYPPPTFTEPIPIWNSANWEQVSSDNLTIDTTYLDAHYVKYPIAQGALTLQDVDTDGNNNFFANITLNNELYPTITTLTQGQYYMNISSNSTNADGAVLKLTNTQTTATASLGCSLSGGLNVNRGISVGCNTTTSGNTITIQADPTTANKLDVSGILSATGNIISTTGNISSTAGSISAGTTLTAGTGITANTGNIVATTGNISSTAGSISAGTTLTAGTGITANTGNIVATTGNISSTAGSITAGTSLTSSSGDLYLNGLHLGKDINTGGLNVISNGMTLGNNTNTNYVLLSSDTTTNQQLNISNNVKANGSVSASTTITAGTGITSTTGNIVASAGTISGVNGSITTTQTYGTSYPTQNLASIGYVNTAINSIVAPVSVVYTSTNSATNGWTFSGFSTAFANVLSYTVYSDNVASTASKTQLPKPINYGALLTNNSSFVATGNGIVQPISGTSQTYNTACAGYNQNYTYGASGSGYVLSVLNTIGGNVSWTINSNTVGENTGNCPPTASGSFSFTYTLNNTITLPTACYVKIVLTKIA